MSFQCHFAISAAVHFGQYSFSDKFNLFFSREWLLLQYLHIAISMNIVVELFDQSTSSQYAIMLLKWCCLCQYTVGLQHWCPKFFFLSPSSVENAATWDSFGNHENHNSRSIRMSYAFFMMEKNIFDYALNVI